MRLSRRHFCSVATIGAGMRGDPIPPPKVEVPKVTAPTPSQNIKPKKKTKHVVPPDFVLKSMLPMLEAGIEDEVFRKDLNKSFKRIFGNKMLLFAYKSTCDDNPQWGPLVRKAVRKQMGLTLDD